MLPGIRRKLTISVGLMLIMGLGVYSLPFAHAMKSVNGENASVVIGQPDFTTGAGGSSFPCHVTSSGLCGPANIAFDRHGNLWVVDEDNSRVLRFNAPFTNGEKASLVIGQPDFTSHACATTQSGLCDPTGVAFDHHGNLWVADEGNNRVLSFERPFSNGENASRVIGQSGFTTGTCTGDNATPTQRGLCSPSGIAFDQDGDLWVADHDNNRVLTFETPISNGDAAAEVVGQPNFNTNACDPSSPTQDGLCGPKAIAFDRRGNLWVADSDNNRVVEFPEDLSVGAKAMVVLGQGNFTSSTGCEPQVTTDKGLCTPVGLAFDKSGNLWVSENDNNRVVRFQAPFRNGEKASAVIGQGNFTSRTCPAVATASGLCETGGIAFDKHGRLWVADDEDNRVLGFKVLGQAEDSDREDSGSSSGEEGCSQLGHSSRTISVHGHE